MNNNIKIFSELSEKEKNYFISSCLAKKNNLFGCPRLILKNKDKINKKMIQNFFSDLHKFEKIDKKYFPLISESEDSDFLQNYIVLFDKCQFDFTCEDSFSSYLSEDLRKIFNFNLRIQEQEKFLISNSLHYGDKDTICEKIIFEKLKNIWKSKWNKSESYINLYDDLEINIIND
jgi:hypothetical protein